MPNWIEYFWTLSVTFRVSGYQAFDNGHRGPVAGHFGKLKPLPAGIHAGHENAGDGVTEAMPRHCCRVRGGNSAGLHAGAREAQPSVIMLPIIWSP